MSALGMSQATFGTCMKCGKLFPSKPYGETAYCSGKCRAGAKKKASKS